MENITIGQISVTIAFIVALIGGCKYIVTDISKIMDKALKPTNDKIDKLEVKLTDRIKDTDLNSTKNFLVAKLQEVKAGQQLDDITTQRFWEQYQHYTNLGGNSYIMNEVDKLKKEGKL